MHSDSAASEDARQRPDHIAGSRHAKKQLAKKPSWATGELRWLVAFPQRDEYTLKMQERTKQHFRDTLGPGFIHSDKLRTCHAENLSLRRTSLPHTRCSPQVPGLNLNGVLPSVIRSVTARASLRLMSRGERRPYTGMYSTRRGEAPNDTTHGSDAATSAPRTPHSRHGSQAERIHTANTQTSLQSACNSTLFEQHSMASMSMQQSLHTVSAVQSQDSFAWGKDTQMQARQDELFGTGEKYSAVHARVSNVCMMYLTRRKQELQQKTDNCQAVILQSIAYQDEPEAMVATKAHMLGTPSTLGEPSRAQRLVPVRGQRPPSSSQSSTVDRLLFNAEDHILRDPLAPVKQESRPRVTTFLTETEIDDEPATKRDAENQEEGWEEGGKTDRTKEKVNFKTLNIEVADRLIKLRSTFRPVAKNVGVINDAIKLWLKAGGRQVKFRNGDAVIKNNFDSAGNLARTKQIDRVKHLLNQQKEILDNPHLDLHLHDDDRERSKGDFVGYNIEFVDETVPHVRNAQLLRQVVKRANRVEKVAENRSAKAQNKLGEIHLSVERTLPGAKALIGRLQAHHRGLAVEIQQTIVGIHAIKALRAIQLCIFAGRIYNFTRDLAAKKIQRGMRGPMALKKQRGGIVWARTILKFFVRNVYSKRRKQNKGPAADLIQKFLQDMQQSADIVMKILLFKRRINLLQRASRVCVCVRERKNVCVSVHPSADLGFARTCERETVQCVCLCSPQSTPRVCVYVCARKRESVCTFQSASWVRVRVREKKCVCVRPSASLECVCVCACVRVSVGMHPI